MNIRKIILFTITASLLSACNNNLNILAPYKDTTVVYGLLDQNDNTHYIRINKAYEGAGNAYTMAQVYDSINYPYGTLSVQVLDYNSSGNLVNTYNCDSTTSIPLSAGIFSYPYQIIYKFTTPSSSPLNASDTFQLVIHNEKTGKTITGSTTLLQDLAITSYGWSASTLAMSSDQLYPSIISWNSTVNGRLYQMEIVFNFDQISSGDTTFQSIDWFFPAQTAPGLAGGYSMQYEYTASQFYTLLRSSLTVSPYISRLPLSFNVIFTTGSDDLNTYIQLSQPSLGINQDIPTFSDIKNGIGIFTSRHVQTFTKQVSQALMDSLVGDPVTQPLNFINN